MTLSVDGNRLYSYNEFTEDELPSLFSQYYGRSKLERSPRMDVFQYSGCPVGVSPRLYKKEDITGNIDEMEFDIAKKYSKYETKAPTTYEGNINEQDAFIQIHQGWSMFQNDTIEGAVGDKPINLSVKKSWGNKCFITGSFDGEEINLALIKNNNGSYSMLGANTDYKVSNRLLARHIMMNSPFEYNKELLPVLLAYAKERIEGEE